LNKEARLFALRYAGFATNKDERANLQPPRSVPFLGCPLNSLRQNTTLGAQAESAIAGLFAQATRVQNVASVRKRLGA